MTNEEMKAIGITDEMIASSAQFIARKAWLADHGFDKDENHLRYFAAVSVIRVFENEGEAYPDSLAEGSLENGNKFVAAKLSDGRDVATGYVAEVAE